MPVPVHGICGLISERHAMSAAASQSILAVDDSASMRQMVRFTLEGAGYKVVQASDGVEALKCARGGGRSGAHRRQHASHGRHPLVRELRALPAYKFVPMLVLTTESGNGDENARQAGRRDGLDRQAVQPEQLLATISSRALITVPRSMSSRRHVQHLHSRGRH